MPKEPAETAQSPAPATRRGASRRLRAVGGWALQLLLALVVIWGVGQWQARRLLATKALAPDFTLTALDGRSHSLAEARGKKTVLYFFAPWCKVCGYSSSNVNALRRARSPSELAIYAVGLEWDDEAELRRFAREHELSMPVLRGDEALRKAYRVDTFPTVYILDEQGTVTDRIVGYTSELGLRLRSL